MCRPSAPAEQDRLRVGYLSADLREHPVGRFLIDLLEAHDRLRVEVHCLASQAARDALTEALIAAADHWHWVGRHRDLALRDLVQQLGIHVLVDLSGHTAGNRLRVFARRAAPMRA